jgi:multidrug efflux pump subunit AcrB
LRALAVTVGMALLTSLALALTWTPTLINYFLKSGHGKAHSESGGPSRLMRIYERVLRLTLEHPLMLAVFSVVLIAGSYLCYTHTGSDLLPAMDEGGFIIDYIMPAGSSLEETNRVITHVENILRKRRK